MLPTIGANTMATVKPYHTNNEEPRDVHHTRDDCPDGKRIKSYNKEQGTGNKPLCKECKKLGG